MGKLKAVGLGVKALEDAFKAEQAAEKMYTAADRAKAGNKAAELIKSQPKVKASEALGQAMEKGYKKVSTTQSDRTRVGGDNIGGANFSVISEADPEYARKVWGVMDEGTASRLTNLSSPETIWTTMLGSANQLKTNPVVFNKLKKQFIAAMKEGKLSPELEAKFNHNLELTFGEGAQIRDPNIWKEADTFEKRAALADLMMGQGITPKKGGVAMGGEKSGKGVIFKPTDTLIQETEPSLLHPEHGGDAPTFALGPRLFNLSGTAEMRPDLHPGFPMLLHGEDLGYNFEPVPTEVFLPTWHKHFRDIKPERFQGPWAEEIINRRKNKSYKLKGAEGPGYYDLALGLEGEGLPSQDLHDEFIRHLIREGYAEGGEVNMGKGGLLSKGVKALEEAMTKIPKGSAEAQAKIEREFAEEAARKAALYKVDKPSGEVGNKALDEARRILSNDDITKAHGGVVHMAEGSRPPSPRKYVPPSQLIPIASQEFPLQKPANVTEADMTPTELHPIAGALSRGVANVHDFVSKPFGYENPPMEMASELMGLPAISKTLENYAYGTPNTKGSGQATRLNEEAVDAAMSLPFGSGQTIKAGIKGAVKGAKELAPTAGKLAQEFAEKTQFGMPLELNVVPPSQAVGKAAEVKAPANDLGLYSVVEKAALNLQRKSGNGDAFLSDLMKNQGVSQARLDETGLTAALKGRKGVTREEVQQLAAEGKVPLQESVKYDDDATFNPSNYPELSTNGGENYREIRIKLPSSRPSLKNMSIDEYNAAVKKADSEGIVDFYQTNHHGDEPNVLAHLRVADHVDVDGKKGLLIDELQSDWHQKGRDKGYRVKQKPRNLEVMPVESGGFGVYDKDKNSFISNHLNESAANNYMQTVLRERPTAPSGVPDAPFKEDWYQLGLKRAIKEATDNGMDRVYLTTGKTQNERYSLSNHIEDIHYINNGDGTFKIMPRQKGSQTALDEINGVDLHSVPEEELENLVGKEVAKKIIKGEGTDSGVDSEWNTLMRLKNLDLEIGGEGMKQYYDKTYLNFLKKYAKQHGAEVGMTTLPNSAKTRADLSAKQMHELMDNPEFKKILDDEFIRVANQPITTTGSRSGESNAWNAALKRFGGQPVYYLDLNPALKNTAKKGQAFADGGAVQSPNDFDYESHVNNIMNAHNASNFDYEGHVKKIMGMAEGGAAYNTQPDMSDGGLSIPAAAFKIGGRIPLLTR